MTAVNVDEDGTVHIPAFELPPSAGWSAQARRVFIRRSQGPTVSARSVGQPPGTEEEAWLAASRDFRDAMVGLHRTLLDRVITPAYDADVVESEVAGVRVQIVTPQGGVHPDRRDHVLINLHGGAFVGGAEYCGLVESIPIASIGGYRVVVVDYRQGWEHTFPAASEDVAAVYRALLGTHDPRNVGIFGYSAGGSLTAQAVAWFVAHDLPVPGAAAICSAGGGGPGAGGGGDATYLAAVAMAGPPVTPTSAATGGDLRFGYFAGLEPTNPLVAPIHAPELLKEFPPTLLLSGTRSFDLSGAAMTHRALLRAGAPAELHVWEGMWHCFPYNAHIPEAKEAFDTLVGFFDRHLG